MLIWKNGELISALGAIDAFDRGAMLGDGLFETMAFNNGIPLRLNRHIARLVCGLDILGIEVDISEIDVRDAGLLLSTANNLTEGALRLTVLRGVGARGVLPANMDKPTIIMSLSPAILCNDTPLNLVVSEITRRNDQSPMSRIKSTNYGDAILARREAEKAGADDALLLNTRGTLAEATSANVFCVVGDQIITPPVKDGALPGVMRDIVLEQTNGSEQPITQADLREAQEVFLTSSISIRPVISINDISVGNAQPGPVFNRLVSLPVTAI